MTLDLNCANFYDEEGKNLKFPPEGLKQHPQKINRKEIAEAIKRGEPTLVIKAENNVKQKESEDITK